MSPIAFLNQPDLVSIAPVPTPRHVLSGQDLDVRCERKVDHKLGLTIKPNAPSDGPRRSVTFVPLSILPEPMDRPVPSTAEAAQGGSGVMTIEVGPDLRLCIPGDVAVERAAALVRALRGAA